MGNGVLRITLELMAQNLAGGALADFANGLLRTSSLLGMFGSNASGAGASLGALIPVVVGAGAALVGFAMGLKAAVEAGALLQQAGTMASIAISDGSQHVGELETAIVSLANTSQYKIADIDQAFRVLGGLGFTSGQILGGLGEQSIILAQAMGGSGAGISAADAAQLLGQAIYIFGQKGLTAKQAADELTGAFYNNMMSVGDLQQYLGMAGGTASSLGVSFGDLLTFGSMLTPMFGSASSAGSSLAYMMRNLAHPATAAMAKEIQNLGLQIYDSKGNFVGLKSIMDQLFEKTANMTQAQKMDVFGTLFNVRSGRAAMDLMSQTQASFDASYGRIQGRIETVGQAQRDSNAINNTVIGTWHRLTTTINDFFAKAGEGIGTALLPLLNWLNKLFSALQNNPGFEKFLGVFLVAGTVISGLVIVIAVVTAAIILFGSAVAIVAGVFAGIVLAAAGVAAAFMLISTHTQQTHGILAAIIGVIQAVAHGFGDAFATIGRILGPFIGNIQTIATAVGAFGAQAQVTAGQALGHLGQALSGLQPIVSDLGTILNWLWHNIMEPFFRVFILGLGPELEALGAMFSTVWNAIVMVVSGAITLIAGILQLLISIFEAVFGVIIAVVSGHSDQVPGILENAWNSAKNGVLDIIKGLGLMILGILTGTFGAIFALLGGFIAGFIQFFQHLWDTLVGHSIIPDLVNSIVSWIAQLPSRMVGALGSLVSQVGNVFNTLRNTVNTIISNLATDLLNAGLNLAKMLAQGITNGIGAVKNAAGGIINAVKGFLGFHSPTEEGPGATADQWMPALMQMLATGILQNVGLVGNAAAMAATAISTGLTNGVQSPAVAGVQAATAAAASARTNAGLQNGQTIQANLVIDDKVLATVFLEYMNGQLRQNGATRLNR